MDIPQEVNLRTLLVNLACAAGIKPGAAKSAGDQRVKALGTLLQLPLVKSCVDAKVVEEREGDRAGDGNAVLGIGGQGGIAADGGYAIDRNRNLVAQAQFRLAGHLRNATAVRVGVLNVGAGGYIAVRRGAADIESAQVALAAGVEAVVGRSHCAAVSLHIAQLRAQAEYVTPIGRWSQVVHRPELLVSHKGRDIAHIAPDAGGLKHR